MPLPGTVVRILPDDDDLDVRQRRGVVRGEDLVWWRVDLLFGAFRGYEGGETGEGGRG